MTLKISVTVMLFLLVIVMIASVLGTTYAVTTLGLIKYPQPAQASSGTVTVSVRGPAEVSVRGGEVMVKVIPENESGQGA